ncbi:Enolase N-terminal domain-like protein [Methanocaldococcus bathoardescens]|uniref:Enolase N-terminal domain-like protein n=2 Tax=Methanocaldococcus bathoardescens TaxID=1301915 RepID=A0A076LIU4_9EURY|nr:Enolase N-terminal domain-like protein [Methanocaldococcus bathoardescens]
MITTMTNISIGYDIIEVNNPEEAIADVENVIAPELIGYPATDIDFIDTLICETSVNNPTVAMGISISVARAASNSLDIPLFKFLGGALTTDLPIVASGVLVDKDKNELIPIVMAESIEDIVNLYLKLADILSEDYSIVNINGAYTCKDIFNEIPKIRNLIDEIKEDEDLDILLGLSSKKEIVRDKDLSQIDYLEVEEPVEFDGFLCTDSIYEESDFVKVFPYEMGTITEMYYYINYIMDKGLYPVIFGNNSSFAHVAVSFKVPFLRAALSSNVLNEVWNIERTIVNPNIRRF